MKIDDIFEAMTDIDDKFIEAARPLEQYDGTQPIAIKPAPRKAVWKSLVPAAAFVAVATAAGVVGVNYLRGYELRTDVSPSVAASLKEYWYPDEAEYVVSDDIKYLGFAYSTTYVGGPSKFDASADYAGSYKELGKKSDLIVSGTFIDVIHQTSDSKATWSDGDHLMMSYNWFEVNNVIKGDITAGSVLTIGQNSTINSANGNDDKYNVFTCDQLSPMLKGDKWIYFLKLEEDGTFSPVNGPQGRYPMPDYTNRLITWDGETTNVDEFSTYKNAAPAREEIYEELLKKLAEIEIKAPEFEYIRIPETSFTTISIEEFPDVEFNVSRLGITANDDDIFDMKDGETLENLYLADLNNDGKRELCATISGVTKSVAVFDYENGDYYTLSGKRDYFLSTENGVLMLNDRSWYSSDMVVTKTSELSLDLMKPVGESQEDNKTFSNEDIASCENDALTRNGKQELAELLTPGMWHTGEYDINDDGEQELLISLFNFTNMPGVFVYDKNCEYLGSFETEKGRCTPELIKLYEDDNERFWYYNGAECPEVVDENGDSREIYRQGIYKIIAGENGFSTEMLIYRDVFFKNGSEEKTKGYIGDREVVLQDYIEAEALYDRWCYRSEGYDLTNPEDWIFQQNFENSHVGGINEEPLPESVKFGDYLYYEITPDAKYSINIDTFFPAEKYGVGIENGKLGELFWITDVDNNTVMFVFSNESNGEINAVVPSADGANPVGLVAVVDIGSSDDEFIEFKDGRKVSLNNLVSRINNS